MSVEPLGIVAQRLAARAAVVAANPGQADKIMGKKPRYATILPYPLTTAGKIEEAATGSALATLIERKKEIRRQIELLKAERSALRAEVDDMKRAKADPRRIGVAHVTNVFLAELAKAGVTISGTPVTLDHFRFPRRSTPYIGPRMTAMVLCRDLASGATAAMVGDYFHRDYTTLRNACERVPDLIHRWPQIRAAAIATCAALSTPLPGWLR